MSAIDVIVGGQFGSEAKGRVTLERVQHWADNGHAVASMRVAGPNAGHVVWDQGHRFAMRSLPVGFVDPGTDLYIAAGSEVDIEVLQQEVDLVESYGYEVRDRLYIHPQATWLEPVHRDREASSTLTAKVGSTSKGIGAARSDRIWRVANLVGDNPAFQELGRVSDFTEDLRSELVDGSLALVIEGTQGYGLGLHAGHYPQCTSSDARAIDFLAMAGINPWDLSREDLAAHGFRIHVVIRPFPIRVAGNSGELSGETSWDELGLEAERTTVTNKIRRVGQFDPELVRRAVLANGVNNVKIHLSMADQLIPQLAGLEDLPEGWRESEYAGRLREFIDQIPFNERLVSLGTGPHTRIELFK
ncbi:PurA-like adenylosuccinate synthetase [Gordonia phage Archimedes]|uniref:N6-succino-2-amino-2'-deoxyadenylate synthase n=1 Tax=Gordonia phage Archimedes TaxID=2759389 RepID=A0A7L7SI10_9CAUD|nr:2-aminooxy adenylosuccinate synthetase [Gordonia phage Archimedes]QOC55750.1 PurA-like adenylosuccinate synthetase [Gordonia phage Archimedes]